MFMCKRCHDRHEKHDFEDHLCTSFGRCDSCGNIAKMCVDCNAHKKRVAYDVARSS